MYYLLMGLTLLLLSPHLIHANELNSSLAIGIVTRDNSSLLISTTKKSLRDDIVLICSPVNRVCKSILSESLVVVGANESVEDVATGKNIYTYSLLDDKSLTDIDIAIVHPKASTGKVNVTFGVENNILVTDNKHKYSISLCASNEGVHIYSDPKKFHLYYSLGYEVMANCSEGLYE
ncbi:hypothetical protein [Enterobacter hormaechei]|uniref:hypothetical protein n=1 Tax=Enterobacter hormaechei TaxID=158836 RepID=UPI0022EFEA45|nr:hypothetical protein [Enterobacter hormaechei]MDA4642835.1 hypothetical protein [Enterobacter hormaechei]MDA4839781.1 hypothetical protein [Enterobacter hormaechei]